MAVKWDGCPCQQVKALTITITVIQILLSYQPTRVSHESQAKCEGAKKEKEYASQVSLGHHHQEYKTRCLSSLDDPLEYGRQMGWLPTSTGKSNDNNSNSDTNTTNLLPADENESESQAKGKGTKAKEECASQGSLEYHLLTYRISVLEYARRMGWLPTSTRAISDNYINLFPADKDETEPKGEGAKKECVSQGSLEYHQEYYSEMEKDINTTLRTQTAIESVTQKKSNVVRPSALEYGRQMGWVP